MYYVVNGYRFITEEMDAAKICVQQNIYKTNFNGCVTKISKNHLQKTL